MHLVSLGPSSRSKRWMHKMGKGSRPISGAETMAGHFQNNKWAWQAGMSLCSDLEQASVEDLICVGWFWCCKMGLGGPAGTEQLCEGKNKKNLRYKSNLSLQDIYKSSELWSPLLRACFCPRGISIQKGGGEESKSADFSQFLSLIFFFPFSFQAEKKHLRNWELLVRSLEVHEPSWAQSPPGQAKHKQVIWDAPCCNESAA